MRPLDIPDAAIEAVERTPYLRPYTVDAAREVCQAAAPAIVAAELLALVEHLEQWTLSSGIAPDPYTKAVVRDVLLARVEEIDPKGSAARLRAQAYDLYRRSDNVPLGRDAHDTGQIERFAQLRDEADSLMRRARRLDPRGDG